MNHEILKHLPGNFPWQVRWYSTLPSTNDLAKEMGKGGAPHGTVILADSQTKGRGRMGRSFHSPAGSGIYLSMLLRPECSASDLMHLTCAAAVAAADGIQAATGLRPGIKWTNDLVVEKKKLGGILTELSLDSQGNVDFAVVGIGINCTQNTEDFPEELQGMATSLWLCTGQTVDRDAVIAAILVALQNMWERLWDCTSILCQYRRDCITIGQEVSLVRGEEIRHGKALAVDDAGGLVVQFTDGQVQTVSSGEISIRGMYGYI